MSKPMLFIKIGNDDEFEVSEKIPQLKFLGETTNPVLNNNYLSNNGTNGNIHEFSTFDKSTVVLDFFLRCYDYSEFIELKQEIYRLFMQKKLFRIRTELTPTIVELVRMNSFEIKPIENGVNEALITINADNPSGFRFSRDDSIHQQDLWDDYQLNSDQPILTKKDFEFGEREFVIYNPSDKAIDPYLQRDKLQIVCQYNGSYIDVTNETNGTNWRFNKSATKNDEVILDGITTYQNGNVSSLNSNFGNLVLEKGPNKIRINGTDDFNIKFIFPFIYV